MPFFSPHSPAIRTTSRGPAWRGPWFFYFGAAICPKGPAGTIAQSGHGKRDHHSSTSSISASIVSGSSKAGTIAEGRGTDPKTMLIAAGWISVCGEWRPFSSNASLAASTRPAFAFLATPRIIAGDSKSKATCASAQIASRNFAVLSQFLIRCRAFFRLFTGFGSCGQMWSANFRPMSATEVPLA